MANRNGGVQEDVDAFRDEQFDRRVAEQVLGWPAGSSSTEVPCFSTSDAAAVFAALRTGVPSESPSRTRALFLGVELWATSSEWHLEVHLAHEAPSQKEVKKGSVTEPSVQRSETWTFGNAAEILRPILEEAAAVGPAQPLPLFRRSAFQHFQDVLKLLDSPLRRYPNRFGFRLQWLPVSDTWKGTMELVPGRIRATGTDASPVSALEVCFRDLANALLNELDDTASTLGRVGVGRTRLSVVRVIADFFDSHRRARPGVAPTAPSPAYLRRWRDEHSLTQEEAGRLVGVTRRGWQSWELGTNPVPQWMGLALDALEGRLSPES